jgi:hypothetical protein
LEVPTAGDSGSGQQGAPGIKVSDLAPRPLIGILQQALADLPRRRLDSLYADLGEVARLMKSKYVTARPTPLSGI